MHLHAGSRRTCASEYRTGHGACRLNCDIGGRGLASANSGAGNAQQIRATLGHRVKCSNQIISWRQNRNNIGPISSDAVITEEVESLAGKHLHKASVDGEAIAPHCSAHQARVVEHNVLSGRGCARSKGTNHQRRLPCRKSLPIEQLVNEIGERDQYAKQCGGESGECHQAQGNLGKIGDSQHCQVIKRIKIVLGDAAFAHRGLPLRVVFDDLLHQQKVFD